MNRFEKMDLLEATLRKEDPKASLAIIYARMYGILSAHITDEVADTILRLKGIAVDEQECSRCGKIVSPLDHPEIGCDI